MGPGLWETDLNELGPNLDVMDAIARRPIEGRLALVLLIAYGDDAEAQERYTAWINRALPAIDDVGGRLAWAGLAQGTIVGDPGVCWDIVAVIEFPTREAFVSLIEGPVWDEIDTLRVQGLEHNEIIVCLPVVDTLDR